MNVSEWGGEEDGGRQTQQRGGVAILGGEG